MNEPTALQVFVSYSHRDEAFVDQLRRHLSPLKREGLISIQYDRDNWAGSQLDRAIHDQITSAGMFLALISSDYIDSDYCFNKELPLAMECRERGTATVIPVILRPCDWMNLPIATLLALPTDGVPVTSWKDRDEAFVSVAKGIRDRVIRSGWQDRAPEERRAALEQPLIQALFETPANTAQVNPVLVPAARRVLIRSEGICELLDDILITPSNVAPPADTADVYLELFLNSPITSRLLFSDLTDTVLIVGCGSSAVLRFGRIINPQGLRFEHIPVPRPGGPSWRIANLRVYAAQFGGPSAVTCLLVSNVPIAPEIFTVATTGRGLGFKVERHLTTLSRARASHGTHVATLRFEEGFANAFKPQFRVFTALGLDAPCVPLPDHRLHVWTAESGAANALLGDGQNRSHTLGATDHATRLRASFAGVPFGVRLFVSCREAGGSSGLRASLTRSEYGPFEPVIHTEVFGAIPAAELPLIDGCGSAIWEVTNRPSYKGWLEFSVFASQDDNSDSRPLALGTISVWGSFAPISTTVATAARPLPRFVDTSAATDLLTLER
ncbi:MAG: toll/interleukin-1 receptor domain-containing protein [Bryobacteraceae bacterium]